MQTAFTRHAGVSVPLICGPMYPCSNPELVAAVSEAGGLGVIQPLSLTYVHGYEFRAGLRHIRTLTTRPLGFNALIEASSRRYLERMRRWIDIALEEGVRFFITSLGDPRWVCDRVHAVGGVVYHDVTEPRWARKGIDGGADGLIAVNASAGGHAGSRDAAALFEELRPFGLPLVAAGGVGTPQEFARLLGLGYAAAQFGTRFIASTECSASDAYKQAIVAAGADDIVLTERLSGVPVAVIRNAHVERLGTRAGPVARWMLRGRRTKHWMRMIYTLRSFRSLKQSLTSSDTSADYWQAGRSVAGIHEVLPAGEIVRSFAAALSTPAQPPPSPLDAIVDDGLRQAAHRMLDDMLDYALDIRERPVWTPMRPADRAAIQLPAPEMPADPRRIYEHFRERILPFAAGNVHPGFMGWVQGGGNPVGMLAEMLSAGLNANCGGRDHAPILVEQQVVEWARQWFGFPPGASGLFVTGTSMANFIAVLVARHAALGPSGRTEGVGAAPRLVAYTSVAAHACIARAMDYAGLGSQWLRLIPVDAGQRLSLPALREAIQADRAAGHRPFLLIGTAGTVDVGAIDDLDALADFAAAEGLRFHVDGAFGALGVLTPELAPRLAGIERADSVALDFHKWAQVPYDAGFLLVRDGALHRGTFATSAPYLRRGARGLGADTHWPNDFGPDLSRSFKALKVWFTLRAYGTRALGDMIAGSCRIARHLESLIQAEPRLELLAPVPLNIVCFRYRGARARDEAGLDAAARDDALRDDTDLDALNEAIVADVQESGVAVPSSTCIGGRTAIRAAIFNHRTREQDVEALLRAVLECGERRGLLANSGGMGGD